MKRILCLSLGLAFSPASPAAPLPPDTLAFYIAGACLGLLCLLVPVVGVTLALRGRKPKPAQPVYSAYPPSAYSPAPEAYIPPPPGVYPPAPIIPPAASELAADEPNPDRSDWPYPGYHSPSARQPAAPARQAAPSDSPIDPAEPAHYPRHTRKPPPLPPDQPDAGSHTPPAPLQPPTPPAARRALRPARYLHISAPGMTTWTMPLPSTGLAIGREHDNQLILEDEQVSRYHARLELHGSEWWLIDLGSSNGAYVNNQRIQRQAVYPGDVIRLGNTMLVVG